MNIKKTPLLGKIDKSQSGFVNNSKEFLKISLRKMWISPIYIVVAMLLILLITSSVVMADYVGTGSSQIILDPASAGVIANGYQVGDEISYIIEMAPKEVDNGKVDGASAYGTVYVPPGVTVVNAEIVAFYNGSYIKVQADDAASAPNGWGNRKEQFKSFSYGDGHINEVQQDTGIFYSTDIQTKLLSTTKSITPSGTKTPTTQTVYNDWDYNQVVAFGRKKKEGPAPGGPLMNPGDNDGKGSTPIITVGGINFGTGSAVAGPDTYYTNEYNPDCNTGTTAFVDDLECVGPWQRIEYGNAKIGGSGAVTPATAAGSIINTAQSTTAGHDFAVDGALPATTNAVRYTFGARKVGEIEQARITLKITNVAAFTASLQNDTFCMDGTGGDYNDPTKGPKDNIWRYYESNHACFKSNGTAALIKTPKFVNGVAPDGSLKENDIIGYEITFYNTSTTATLYDIDLTDVPLTTTTLELVSAATTNCPYTSYDGNQAGLPTLSVVGATSAAWNTLGSLAPGQSVTVHMCARVKTNVSSGSEVKNQAVAKYALSSGATQEELIANTLQLGQPTALPVTLGFFQAIQTETGLTRLEWQTTTETANMGFNLYMEGDDGLQRLNEELILSQEMSSLKAFDYRFDAHVRGGTFYIEDVDIFGNTKRHGPFELGEAYGRKAVQDPIDWAAIGREHNLKERARNAELRRGAQTRLAQATAVAINSSSRGSGPLVRLHVDQSGMHRVTHADLLAAGIDLSGRGLNYIALTQGSNSVPIAVSGNGGIFGPGSYIEFYGQVIETLYSKESVYTLHIDAALATRAEEENTPVSGTPATSYQETILLGDDKKYDTAMPGASPWYDTRFVAQTTPITKSYNIAVDNYVAGGGPVTLNVDMVGITDWQQNPDHHVKVTFGGQPVADVLFDGLQARPLTIDLGASLVQTGTNSLQISVPNDLGLQWDVVNLDTYGLTYPRSFVAKTDGHLTFTATSTAFQVNGLPTANIVVYRYEGSLLTKITNLNVTGTPGNYSVSFAGSSANGTYLVYSIEHLLTPTLTAARPYTDISNGTADYLMIAHADFVDGLTSLVAYHQGNGRSVRVVDVADIYSQYGDGTIDPQAIKDYLQYAAANMGVEYVLLVGGDTYDYFDILGIGSISFIPSPYIRTGSYVNFAPVDPLYADVDGDLFPDLKLGRFPVRTSAELAEMIDKTLLYTQADYKAKAIFSADALAERSFSAMGDDFASHLPYYWETETAYLDENTVADARSRLIDSINSGVGLTSYVGHSGADRWTFLGLFNAADAGSLSNVGRPTVVTQWGCWNTYHVQPYYTTLGQQFMLGNTGAAAVLGAATLTTSTGEDMLGQAFMAQLAEDDVTIGEALHQAKVNVESNRPGMLDIQLGYTLLGDPALMMAGKSPTSIGLNSIDTHNSESDIVWIVTAALVLLTGLIFYMRRRSILH